MIPFIPTPYRYSCIKNWVRGAETKITEPVTMISSVFLDFTGLKLAALYPHVYLPSRLFSAPQQLMGLVTGCERSIAGC